MSGVQLPNLPGFVSNKHKASPKGQTLKFGPGGASVSFGPEGNEPMFFGSGKKEWDPSVTKSKAREAASRQAQVADMATGRSAQATWHPLTLRAYWKEELPTGTFPHRIRQLLILYYLDDDTLEVREKKTANAGLPQGTFVKKHKVPKGKDGFITARDLQPGTTITVYGRQFHLLGCVDDLTRERLASMGVDVSFEGKAPTSPEEEAAAKYPAAGHAANREFKDYNETMLGATPLSMRKLGAFLDFGSTPPLKFQAVWRDERMYGDLNRYTISFYLEDRTFKIIDDVEGNEGKGPFTTALKRQKIPKNYRVDASSIGHQDESFYDVTDLYIGNTIPVHGKSLLIIDVTPDTRKFYAQQARNNPSVFHEQPDALVPAEDAEVAATPKQEPVPYLGGVVTFGSEESSMQSCLSLHPSKPKQDAEKIKQSQGASLKFSAQLVSDKPEDFGRNFVVSFFLFDETVSVFEEGRKNSGIVPGKFLNRTRLKNADAGHRYFQPQDFFVGATLRINDFTFKLDGIDAFSLNYAIHHPDKFPWANLERILDEIRGRTHAGTVIGGVSLGSAKETDEVDTDDFKAYLASFLSKPELDAITQFFYVDLEPLSAGKLREFMMLPDGCFDELIATDTIHSVLADARLPPERRVTKKAITKIRNGFSHAQVSFQGIVDKFKNEHGNVSKANFVKALQEASYTSNVPIKQHDIDTVTDYFFPADAKVLAVNKLYHFLFERKTAKQRVDNRVMSTALHNSVPIKIQTRITAQNVPVKASDSLELP